LDTNIQRRPGIVRCADGRKLMERGWSKVLWISVRRRDFERAARRRSRGLGGKSGAKSVACLSKKSSKSDVKVEAHKKVVGRLSSGYKG